ncbi:biotin--[acetyl-CoA-carboxylase] ligase [Glutamicibacter sp. X7]
MTHNANSESRGALRRDDFPALAQHLGLARVDIVAESGSTNEDLAAAAASGAAGHLSVLCAEHQVQGKGRLGRTWVTPKGSALTVSVLVAPKPTLGIEALSWYTMLAALAFSEAVEKVCDVQLGIKWPNDLLVGQKKVCGILAQLVTTPSGLGVVVGTGMNVDQHPEELPVDTATSLRIASGGGVDRTELLAEYLRRFAGLDAAFRAAGGQADTPLAGRNESLRLLVQHRLRTLGQIVNVEFPDGTKVTGEALELERDGGLAVRASDGTRHHVLAGDVQHVRRADGKYA